MVNGLGPHLLIVTTTGKKIRIPVHFLACHYEPVRPDPRKRLFWGSNKFIWGFFSKGYIGVYRDRMGIVIWVI